VPVIFGVGLASVCFRNVNRNDAVAAYRVFLENQGRRLGRSYNADVQVFDETPAFETAIQQKPMKMAVMGAWQFLTMDVHRDMKPYFAIMENGKVGRKYLVLTRKDSGLETLRLLRGKSFLQLELASVNTGKVWLETQLLAEKLGVPQTFFGSINVVGKPTSAILPVFFGKDSACIVDEASFDLMKELNPQVGKELQTVAVSDSLADVVICLRTGGWESEKDKLDVIQSINELHLQPAGQQLCTLFKIDRMVPFEDAQLDTLRKLRQTFEQLRRNTAP
jgi:phosphonate transport system substrate-binding protein